VPRMTLCQFRTEAIIALSLLVVLAVVLVVSEKTLAHVNDAFLRSCSGAGQHLGDKARDQRRQDVADSAADHRGRRTRARGVVLRRAVGPQDSPAAPSVSIERRAQSVPRSHRL